MNPTSTEFYDTSLAESYLRQVEKDSSTSIDDFLPDETSEAYPLAVETLAKADVQLRWGRMANVSLDEMQEATIGLPPPVESYVDRFSILDDPAIVHRLAVWEFKTRVESNNSPVVAEYLRRFPGIVGLDEELAHSAPQPLVLDLKTDRLIGTSIGPYIIEKKLGEGGFGDVYLAQQTHPVQRSVALKVLKRGMDSEEVVIRFQAEQQALALMDHKNIAQVLDAGIMDSGVPYFVMTFVNGIPITDYCDQNKLTIDDRIAIFEDVCGAIQHAHQKGVIHRDIKPSNILVAEQNGKPIPKVIDFGIAKAVGNAIAGDSVATQYGQIVGTPQYMSPEQASFNPNDVDTRSDVYSLGVVLYELLTGSPPFREGDLEAKAIDQILQIIREVDPAKPSSRVVEPAEQDKPITKSLSLTSLKTDFVANWIGSSCDR